MASGKKGIYAGEAFDSADDAAVHFLKQFQGKSQQEKREYGAVIHKRKGQFYLGPTHIGARGSVMGIFWEGMNVFARGRVYGTIHTHPEEIPRAYGSNGKANAFSGMDEVLRGVRYLGAPNGAVYKSEKKRRPNMLVATGLPAAKNNTMKPEVYGNTHFWPELGFRMKLTARSVMRRGKKKKDGPAKPEKE